MQLSALTTALGRLLAELQRRKVLRIAAAYVVGAWIVLQVALALQTAMSLSGQFSAAILALLVIGFFVTLVLAWFYEITPEGVKRTAPATGDAPLVKPQTTDLALAGALTLVFIAGVAQFFWPNDAGQEATATAESTAATDAAEKPKPQSPKLGDKSIAVLPFKNLSPDKDDAYFADGLTEETLNVLTLVAGLKVISRTSSEAFKGKDTPLSDIAKTLGVRYILEGSVRRDGPDVRITAQLIDAPADTHVWSKTFEPKLEQVFQVQNDIARALALALDLELLASEGARGAPTKNMKAYRIWLQARELSRSGGARAIGLAELYERAIALDPTFAPAWGALSVQLGNQAVFDRTLARTALPSAKQAAATAEKLNADYLGVHLVRGSIAFWELRWRDAEQEFQKLFDNDQARSVGCMATAFMRSRAGYFKDAERFEQEGRSLDPLNRNFDLVRLLRAFDQGDDAVVNSTARLMTWASKEAAAYGYYMLTKIALDKGDRQAAEIQFRSYMAARGTNREIGQRLLSAMKSQASIPTAVKALRAEEARDPSFDVEPFLYLIDPTNAWIEELNARIAKGETISLVWRIGGVWRVIAKGDGDHPKVKALLRNVGLVDYWRATGWPDRCRPKGEDDFECS
jgi:TolB-like protein